MTYNVFGGTLNLTQSISPVVNLVTLPQAISEILCHKLLAYDHTCTACNRMLSAANCLQMHKN